MNTQSTINSINPECDPLVSAAIVINRIKGIVRRVVDRWKLMEQIHAEREILANLSPRMLNDIGIEVGIAYQEATRSYIDLPQGRY